MPQPSQRVTRALLIVWFSLLMGAPYDPSGGTDNGMPIGPVSLSPSFAWVALGTVLGAWVGTHPSVRRTADSIAQARVLLLLGGFVLGLALTTASWINMLFSLLASSPNELSWSSNYGNAFIVFVWKAIDPVISHINILAFIDSFIFAITLSITEQSNKIASRRMSLLVTTVVLGLLQPLAWLILMPHSSFPQPIMHIAPLDNANRWSMHPIPTIALCIVPTVLMALLGMAFKENGTRGQVGGQAYLGCVVGLCCGVLLFRIVSRTMPSVFATTRATAMLSLMAYCLVFIGISIRFWRMNRASSPLMASLDCARENESTNGGDPRKTSDGLPSEGLAYLSAHGLTEQETQAVGAYLLGKTSAQAGTAMGISESTVREYWRRGRLKLKVSNLDELKRTMATSLSSEVGEGDQAGVTIGGIDEEARDDNHVIARMATLALSGLLICIVLVLIPFEGSVSAWSDVWVTGFGIGMGLMSACVIDAIDCSDRKTIIIIIIVSIVLFTISSIILAIIYYINPTWLDGASTSGRLVRLIATSTFVVACFLLHRTLRPAFRRVPSRNVLPYLGVASCLALSLRFAGTSFRFAALVGTVLAVTVATAAVMVLSRGGCPETWLRHEDDRFSRHMAWEAPWLVCAAFFMWTWGETWRAQAYDSPLPILTWGMLSFFVVAIIGLAMSGELDSRFIIYIVSIFILSIIISDIHDSIIIVYVLISTYMFVWGGNSSVIASEPDQWPYWHSGLFAGALGVMGGTLMTNWMGVMAGSRFSALSIERLSSYKTLLVIMLVITVCWCAIDVSKGKAISLGLDEEGLAMSLLKGRGLSEQQALIAISLARGASVLTVAGELHYSRSTVTKARAEAYRVLGVRTRGELASALRSMLLQVNA